MNSYTLHITLYDLFFFGMIFIGLNFAILLAFVKSTNRAANRLLALALVTMILWMMRILAIDIRLQTYLPGWDWLPMQFLLVLGPLIYFYVLKITRPEYKFTRADLIHFSPLLLEQGALVLEIRESIRTRADTYDTAAFHLLDPLLQLFIFISIITYLYRSNKLIQKFYRRLEPVLMDRSRLEFRWLGRLLGATALLWLLWIAYAVVDYFGYRNQLGIHVYYPFYVFFVVIVIWTAMAAFLKPQAGMQSDTAPILQPLIPPELKQKAAWLKKAVETKLLYENTDLSLSTLAEQLDMNPHELSRIVNVALKKSFADFINEYRIRDVARKMQDPAYDKLTLLGIAYDSGFNSKTNFNRAFRRLTGKSPVEYKSHLKKERPFYNTEPHIRSKPLILRRETSTVWSHEKLNRNIMFRNYLKTAWRNIKRHPFISFINLFGLTVGLTCCLLILLYIVKERSYDRFNTNADNIYRVTRIFYSEQGAESLHTGSVAPPFGPLLKDAFPAIEEITRLLPDGVSAVQYKDKLFNEKNAFFADENVFDFFTVPIVRGVPHKALIEPYSIMLTEAMARKYFGDADPMNKTIRLDNNKHEYKVTGIYKSFPDNAHLHPELLLSFSTLKDTAVYGENLLQNRFNNNSFYTYLLLPAKYNVSNIERQLPAFLDKHVHLPNTPGNAKTHQLMGLTFQKLTDIHLNSHLDTEIEENGDINQVYIFSAIALFILLIACINYMNLSTARSVLRAREIGVRKVIGARRKEIIIQFLSESVLITLIALALAILFTGLSLQLLNKTSIQNLSFSDLFHWQVLMPVMGLPFVIGLISGIYPALFMSSFLPVKVLKGILNIGAGSISFRKALVVVQFSISIVLIVATTVVYQQLKYVQNKQLGFNKDHILTMNTAGNLNSKFEAFRNDLLRNPAIKNAGRSSYIPSDRLLSASNASIIQNGSMQRVNIDLKYLDIDYDFLKTYGMQMAAGRNFSRQFPNDTNNYLINETAVKALGWNDAQNAIGKEIKYGDLKGKVVGIVKDFYFESLHQKIIPLLFSLPSYNDYKKVSIKIDGRNVPAAINYLQDTWRKYLPGSPFEYSFLDEKFNKLYKTEQQQGSLFTIFSCVAILIASLGLFGLSAFTITQRIKEIGVRKVLGASVPQIVAELSKGFLKLILIAAMIATPVAWYAMNKWLMGFAFRINISWWVFILACLLSLIIALVTICFQSIKAALVNPIKSLRSE